MTRPASPAQVIAQLAPGLLALADRVARISREEIVGVMKRGSPSGDIDVDPRTGEVHQASAPGEPPAYGAYAESWTTEPAHLEGDKILAGAYSSATDDKGRLVAEELEYGSERVEARPHVRVAIPEIRRKTQELLRRLR